MVLIFEVPPATTETAAATTTTTATTTKATTTTTSNNSLPDPIPMAVRCFNNQPSRIPPAPQDEKISSLWGTGSSPSPPNSSGSSNLFHSCWSPISNSADIIAGSSSSAWNSPYGWMGFTDHVSQPFCSFL
ncbi:unnamed protein product [Gongylonema pulchrum]|uniref:Dof-type domain-containing protein n=1 Tax=Gongylonema pulchrum TaxID=637853 RepID=A0A183ENE0_9BILA|nr:unnamed protein product [Gongylonema pulchrum]